MAEEDKRNPSHRKGKTLVQEYGIKRAKEIRKKIVNSHLGQKPGNFGMRGIYCSPRTEFKKGNPKISGKNSSNWKGGITSKNRIIRASIEYKNWRKKVFERDDYTCQGCDIRGSYLHPHHLISFAKYPEYRFEVWNGQTACKECHENLHKELGYI